MSPPSRRAFLASLLAAIAAAGCGRPPESAPAALPALHDGPLTDLLALANLRWIVIARPREIAAIPWLIPSIGIVVPEENLNRFAASSGVDLRQIPEAVVAAYTDEDRASTFYLVRHAGDAGAVEKLFRTRLTGAEKRAIERPDLVTMSGKIGATTSSLVVVGRDVLGFQHGGSTKRGPARIASLYATNKLKESPSALAADPLRALAARFGSAPVKAMALGPFEGELARGARGLLAGATAIGASARPSAREGIAVAVAVAGDFTKSGEAASAELSEAYRELAMGSFGHLLGLDRPVERLLATHGPDAVAIAVELDARRLATGLAAATSRRVEEMMR